MNLLCPSCQKMLQVPDQYAGQQMRCPMCNSIFTVPGLPAPPGPAAAPPPPAPPPPPLPPSDPYRGPGGPAEVEPIMDLGSAPPPPPPPWTRPAPIQERDYIKMKSCFISKRVVPWITPICMFLVLIFSFIPWIGEGDFSFNVWSLGYGKGADFPKFGGPIFIFYTLFIIFGLVASVVFLLMNLGVIPVPPALYKVRAIIAGVFVWSSFLMLFMHVLIHLMSSGKGGQVGGVIWLNLWGLIGWWFHCIAFWALLIQMWLELRGPAAPSPRVDWHL